MRRHTSQRLGLRSAVSWAWAVACSVLAASAAPALAGGITSSWNEVGEASWYGGKFTGRPTASGEIYDPRNLTAAHKSLPLGSLVRVHNLRNDRRMIVRINDRGPFIRGRVIDLSEAAAEVLGFKDAGIANVRITPVAAPPGKSVPREWAQKSAVEDRTSLPPAASAAPAAAAAVAPSPQDGAITPPPARGIEGDATAAAGGIYVQLGAYRDSRRANEQVQGTAGLGMALMVEYADGVYRVLAGPFENHAAAARAVRDLSGAGVQAFVRRD